MANSLVGRTHCPPDAGHNWSGAQTINSMRKKRDLELVKSEQAGGWGGREAGLSPPMTFSAAPKSSESGALKEN